MNHPFIALWRSRLPGLLLAAAIAALALGARALPVPAVSPLMLAILLGMVYGNLFGRPARAVAGLSYSLKAPLRAGIVLLGLQLTLGDILGIGYAGLALLATAVTTTFLVTVWLGRLLGVDAGLSTLIAAGTSICGASAVVAANTVARESDESVAYALATVTLFGTIAMFGYPLLGGWLALDPAVYGLWTGASVHEVAQVVAAGFARGELSGEVATVSKLARVLMLAPMILTLGWWLARRARLASDAGDGARNANAAQVPMPWFVFGFLGMVLLASSGWLPEAWRSGAALLTQGLLALALAAVGLETNLRRLVAQGWQPLALGALATLFIAASTLLATLAVS